MDTGMKYRIDLGERLGIPKNIMKGTPRCVLGNGLLRELVANNEHLVRLIYGYSVPHKQEILNIESNNVEALLADCMKIDSVFANESLLWLLENEVDEDLLMNPKFDSSDLLMMRNYANRREQINTLLEEGKTGKEVGFLLHAEDLGHDGTPYLPILADRPYTDYQAALDMLVASKDSPKYITKENVEKGLQNIVFLLNLGIEPTGKSREEIKNILAEHSGDEFQWGRLVAVGGE